MATELDMQENLRKIERFFKMDVSIKQGLIDIALNEIDRYNTDSIIAYADKIYDQFEQMKYYILQIISMYGFGEDIDKLIRDRK